MKKWILLPLILLSLCPPLLARQLISEIRVEGNRNVSEQKIVSLIRTRAGAPINENILREDMRALSASNLFREVGYTTEELTEDSAILTINVKEHPVISNITFSGNRSFRTTRLQEILGLREGDIFNAARFNEGLAGIERTYIDRGFHLVEVSYEKEESDERIALNIDIEEEGKQYVREIIFQGNNSFESRTLARLMKVKQRKMPFIKGSFKEETFSRDIFNIEKFYMEEGFLDIRVESEVLKHEGKGLRIIITIKEETRYYIGNISVEGDLIFNEEEIREQLVLKERAGVFNRTAANENISRIRALYSDRGYIRVNVEEVSEYGDSPDIIDLTYFIFPGEKFYAGRIDVRGNYKTRDKVIRREVTLEPGDAINTHNLRRSFNKLSDLGLFENINIYPEPGDEPQVAHIVVDVEEKDKTGMFLIGGGYSSLDKFIGMVSVQQSNFDITNPPGFMGAGQNASMSVELGTASRNYRISFTEPYFLDKPVWLGTDIYSTKREWLDYTDRRRGVNIRTGRRWDGLSLGFTLKTEEIQLSDIDNPLIGTESTKRKNSLTPSLSYSTLDRQRAPTKGNRARFSMEYSGGMFGGDIDFIKPILENDFYYPLGRSVLRSRTYAGTIRELGGTSEIAIYERFFGGGIGTVRGYKERTLGPEDNGLYLGGQSIFAQNFELIYPLYEETLKGVMFFDAGNVWEGWNDFGSLRKSVGLGVQLVVPILQTPIELYYGYPLDREPGDSKARIHFGMSFGF